MGAIDEDCWEDEKRAGCPIRLIATGIFYAHDAVNKICGKTSAVIGISFIAVTFGIIESRSVVLAKRYENAGVYSIRPSSNATAMPESRIYRYHVK
jgi:hypothetical protein